MENSEEMFTNHFILTIIKIDSIYYKYISSIRRRLVLSCSNIVTYLYSPTHPTFLCQK
jgi:hypothetical protein